MPGDAEHGEVVELRRVADKGVGSVADGSQQRFGIVRLHGVERVQDARHTELPVGSVTPALTSFVPLASEPITVLLFGQNITTLSPSFGAADMAAAVAPSAETGGINASTIKSDRMSANAFFM